MNATVEQLAPVEQQATTSWVVAALYQFKEVQLVFRDTRSLNAYVIDNIQTDTLSSSLSQTYQFKNNLEKANAMRNPF